MLAQRHLRLLGQILAFCTAATVAAYEVYKLVYKLPAVKHLCHTIWVALLTLALVCSNATVHPFTPVTGPSVWYADQYKHNTEYIYDLSSEDVAELDAAVAAVTRSEKDIQDATKQDFVLPMLGPKLVGFREEVRTGRGFQLIR